MKRTRRALAFCGIVLLSAAIASGQGVRPPRAGAAHAAGTALASAPTGSVVMAGSFQWSGRANKRSDLQAVFAPAGSNSWSATYTFDWDGKPTVFTGTASGDLANGKVTGTAQSGSRTWRFEARGTAGHLRGRHFETTNPKQEQPTGEFELRTDRKASHGTHA